MADDRPKDPRRVAWGRLGALATHSRGHTNTAPATKASNDRFARLVDPEGVLSPEERERRAVYARRAHMTRLILHRWHGTPLQGPGER